MRVLVTSSRNPFALDIIRKLGSTGHTVVAADTFAGAIGNHSKYAAAYVTTASPRFATDQFIADINQIVERYSIDLILPTFEEAFYLAARVQDLPSSVRLFTGPFAKLAVLHDKVSFQRLAQQAGVPVPETVVATDDASLAAAIAKFPHYFARAAFSRGGVSLLTNTGPLTGELTPDEVHPTAEQPWLVQPFVDGPMVCTYSTIVDGKVTSHCTYTAPEQWDHSTGIAFLAVDSTQTLANVQKLVDTLDPHYDGQLSFDWVDHDGTLYGIECNPRTTDGVILLSAEQLSDGLTTPPVQPPAVVRPGVEREIKLAVLADAFNEPLRHLKTSLHDLVHVHDVDSGWHDARAMLWSPAALVHGAKLERGRREPILEAMGADIVWNGGPIDGMTPADAAALKAVHDSPA